MSSYLKFYADSNAKKNIFNFQSNIFWLIGINDMKIMILESILEHFREKNID